MNELSSDLRRNFKEKKKTEEEVRLKILTAKIYNFLVFLVFNIYILPRKMYHHHQHHPHHLFMQEGNGIADAGLVLSTDAKPRLKWTPELHQRFIEAVNQLGGADSEYIVIYDLHVHDNI